MADSSKSSGLQNGGRRRLSRRARRCITVSVIAAAVLLCLLDLQHAWQYCKLCGKDRDAFSLLVPRITLIAQERPNSYSDVLEPLVHAGGAPHAWADVDRRSFLGRLWEPVQRWRAYGSGGLNDVRSRNAELLKRLAFWDAELAMAAGQYLISGSRDLYGDSGIQVEDRLHQAGHDYYSPPLRDVWNQARTALGLPPLSEEEYKERVADAAERERQWDRVLPFTKEREDRTRSR